MRAQPAACRTDTPRVAALPDSRLALVCLVSAFGAVAVARFEAQHHAHPARAPVAPATQRARGAATGPELSALRDGRPIEINRATASELELLPGVGPSLARRLVEARARAGGFALERDLLAVRGLGPKTLQKLKPFLSFSAKYVEHTADSELPLGERNALSLHPEQADADVAADRPAARREVVDADP
jgi:competence ComEA-like helix-hairpin-helix protein